MNASPSTSTVTRSPENTGLQDMAAPRESDVVQLLRELSTCTDSESTRIQAAFKSLSDSSLNPIEAVSDCLENLARVPHRIAAINELGRLGSTSEGNRDAAIPVLMSILSSDVYQSEEVAALAALKEVGGREEARMLKEDFIPTLKNRQTNDVLEAAQSAIAQIEERA